MASTKKRLRFTINCFDRSKNTSRIFCSLLPLVAYNYARQLLLVGRYEDALEIAQLGWQACVRYGQYSTLPEILEIIAESYYYLGEKEKSKEFYYQAYYISKATGNCRETNDVKDNAKKYLGIDFSF